MPTAQKRTTVYLDPELHKASKIYCALSETSLSTLINELLRQKMQEDKEDLAFFQQRKDEKEISYDDAMSLLQKDHAL